MSTIDEALKAFDTAVAEVGVRNVLLVDQLRGAMARALAAQLPAEQSASAVQPLAEAAHWLDSTEHHIALREAHEIAAERDYFDARPNRDGQDQRAMFEAGFRRGFDAAAKLAAEAAPVAQPATAAVALTEAAAAVLAERRRQIEAEGWTPEHDDEHRSNGMAIAAACYAAWSMPSRPASEVVAVMWPWTGWAKHWFKPKDPRHNLIRAGALILAEIERLDRAHGITTAAEENGNG